MPWPTKKLGEVLELCDAGTWGDEAINGMPLLRSTNIQNSKLVLDDLAVVNVPKEKRERYTLRESDILVTKSSGSEAHIGKALYIGHELDRKYGFSNFMQRLRVNKSSAYPKWVYYIVSNPETRVFILNASRTTSGLRNLNINTLKELKIPLPPIGEQRKIVEKIEKLFAKIDEMQKLRREALDAIKALQASILHEVFSMTRERERESRWRAWEWPVRALSEIAEITSGGTPSRDKPAFYKGKIAWLKSGELNDNQNIKDSEEHITEDALKNSNAKIFSVGTLLLAPILFL